MPRKAKEWPADIVEKMVKMSKHGKKNKDIAAALSAEGVIGINETAVHRVVNSRLGARRATKTAPPSVVPPLPETPDAIPTNTSADIIEQWLVMADTAGRNAQAEGNLAGINNMGRMTAAFLEIRRKLEKQAEPEEDEDEVALSEALEARFLRLIDEAVAR